MSSSKSKKKATSVLDDGMMESLTTLGLLSMSSPEPDSDLQWLKDGKCSRPPTPAKNPQTKKRTRLLRGSPMKLPTNNHNSEEPAEKIDIANSLANAAGLSSQANFPLLPSLGRSGSSSRLSRKFSRRTTVDNTRQLSKSATIEFDKLEMLTTTIPIQNPINNHRQYGISPNSEFKFEKRQSMSAVGRRSSLTNIDSINHRPATNSGSINQSKSTFLDFFRRGGSSGTGGSQGSSASSSRSKDMFDDLTVSKPVVVAADPNRKKSEIHAVMTMQPRSPRYGSTRDRASLPEIERLIRLSQKRKDGGSGSGGNTAVSSDRTNGRKGIKIDN